MVTNKDFTAACAMLNDLCLRHEIPKDETTALYDLIMTLFLYMLQRREGLLYEKSKETITLWADLVSGVLTGEHRRN